jgi:hypothetical protein
VSFFQRSARRHRFVAHTVQIQKCIAPELISLADRLFADDADGAAFRNALRPFFITERPRIAILKGDEIWFHLDGTDHVDLVLATGYLGRLLDNVRVVHHLARFHPEILAEFQKIVRIRAAA